MIMYNVQNTIPVNILNFIKRITLQPKMTYFRLKTILLFIVRSYNFFFFFFNLYRVDICVTFLYNRKKMIAYIFSNFY